MAKTPAASFTFGAGRTPSGGANKADPRLNAQSNQGSAQPMGITANPSSGAAALNPQTPQMACGPGGVSMQGTP